MTEGTTGHQHKERVVFVLARSLEDSGLRSGLALTTGCDLEGTSQLVRGASQAAVAAEDHEDYRQDQESRQAA